ncbi:PadR family transcriptional regulator [Gallicola sp. Sow4_E12]|uniref:PadR family transcriptional regulator n=1 Tax=Gallicola sp. Sow4_E12 TaxID=3438785 RepID=UPI003F91F470
MNPQFKKGILELCVLHILLQEDSYGYDIIDQLSANIDISEGTIYPMLRRFQKEKRVKTYLRESSSGPPRKYYSITEEGKKYYEESVREWEELILSVERIMKGKEE